MPKKECQKNNCTNLVINKWSKDAKIFETFSVTDIYIEALENNENLYMS